MKYLSKIIFLSVVISFNTSIFSQNSTNTLKVLFVGNSYTYYSNLPQLVSQISDHTSIKMITKSSVTGGATLNQHWNSEWGLKTKEIIRNDDFDIVVLQEQSLGTIKNPTQFLKNIKRFSAFIKRHGAKPYLYATWARERIPQQQEIITQMYQQAAKENNIGIVLVGEVWKLARLEVPDIKLYIEDGSHPSNLGAFLTACTFVKEISGELPDTLPNEYIIKNAFGSNIENRLYKDSDIELCLKIAQQNE